MDGPFPGQRPPSRPGQGSSTERHWVPNTWTIRPPMVGGALPDSSSRPAAPASEPDEPGAMDPLFLLPHPCSPIIPCPPIFSVTNAIMTPASPFRDPLVTSVEPWTWMAPVGLRWPLWPLSLSHSRCRVSTWPTPRVSLPHGHTQCPVGYLCKSIMIPVIQPFPWGRTPSCNPSFKAHRISRLPGAVSRQTRRWCT